MEFVFVQDAATSPLNCRYKLYRKQNTVEEITFSVSSSLTKATA